MESLQATTQGPAVRRTKALALVQELQQAEEQHLAEFHPDYQPITHLTRHEIMDSGQDAAHTRADHFKRGIIENNLSFSEFQLPMVAGKDQHPLLKSYMHENTELSYDKVNNSSYHKSYHRGTLSDSITELDASIAANILPELPSPEIDMPRSITSTRQSVIGYGDERYNTLSSEAVPWRKSNVAPPEPKSHGSHILEVDSTWSPLLAER